VTAALGRAVRPLPALHPIELVDASIRGVTADRLLAGTHRAVWWRCPVADDHRWKAPPHSGLAQPSCPFCMGGSSIVFVIPERAEGNLWARGSCGSADLSGLRFLKFSTQPWAGCLNRK